MQPKLHLRLSWKVPSDNYQLTGNIIFWFFFQISKCWWRFQGCLRQTLFHQHAERNKVGGGNWVLQVWPETAVRRDQRGTVLPSGYERWCVTKNNKIQTWNFFCSYAQICWSKILDFGNQCDPQLRAELWMVQHRHNVHRGGCQFLLLGRRKS